jgi:hypothetical protein
MDHPLIAIIGGVLLVGFIFYGFRQGMRVKPDDRRDRSDTHGSFYPPRYLCHGRA